MKRLALLSFLSFYTLSLFAQSPLKGFEPFIGGEWYLENSFQTLEWGVGKKSVIAKNYFLINDRQTLVSEGMWLWHPERRKIIGYFTAINMPVSFFEYETDFVDGVMKSKIKAYDLQGNLTVYQESWTIVKENEFEWMLYEQVGSEWVQSMNGLYIRE